MSTTVMTGKVRFSFCHIFEPQEPQGGGDPKYSVTLLIPKSDTKTLSLIKEAIAEAREVYCRKNGSNALPLRPNTTLHDGDGQKDNGEDFGPECKGCYVITVSSKEKPMVVDYRGKEEKPHEITDPSVVYSGCYGRARINFFGYNRAGKKGISAGLLGIQKLCDGEPFGLRGSVDDFNDGYDAGDGDDEDFMG